MDHANNVRAEASGRKGYTVITAKGGAEAIERVKQKPFDMIFKDDREFEFLLDKIKLSVRSNPEGPKRFAPSLAAQPLARRPTA